MGDDGRQRREPSYIGPMGRLWDRIESERPAGYWEDNFVRGRGRVRKILLSWMAPFPQRLFLDAGCGRGRMARDLAKLGARVVAVDLLPRFRDGNRPSSEGPFFVRGDFRQLFTHESGTKFDAILLQEVFEDYPPAEQDRLLSWLGNCCADRVYLVCRVPGGAERWIKGLLPEGLSMSVDPVSLLRRVHLYTPFRLARQRQVQLRNYKAQVAELKQAPP